MIMASYIASLFSSSSTVKREDAEPDAFLWGATASARNEGASQSIYPSLSAEARPTTQPSTSSAYPSPSLTPDTRRRGVLKTEDYPITPLTYLPQKKNKAIVAPNSPPATPLKSRKQPGTSRSSTTATGSSGGSALETPPSGQLQAAPRRSARIQASGTPVKQFTLASPPSTPLATSKRSQSNAHTLEPPARDVEPVSAIVNPPSSRPPQAFSSPSTSAAEIKVEKLECAPEVYLPPTPVKTPRKPRNLAPTSFKTPPQDAEGLSSVFNTTSCKPSAATIKLEELEFDEPIIGPGGALTASGQRALLLQGSTDIFRNGETLYSFQETDLKLLLKRERGETVCGTDIVNNVGYVLAYEMGCGKTIMSIALIITNTPPRDFEGVKATLVVVPSQGVLDQWISEMKKFAPHLSFSAYRSCNDPLRQDVDVVLCTYDQVQRQSSAGDGGKSPLFDIIWFRIIADEAHIFRNPKSKKANGMWGLRKKHAMCLTGTPAQNTIVDYYSLLKFLEVKYENIDDLATYHLKVFDKNQKEPPNPSAQRILDTVKKSFFIVREKIDSKTEKNFVDLPSRVNHIIDVRLTRDERAVHEHVKIVGESSFSKFMHMRQACDHPVLVSQWVEREQLIGDNLQKSKTFSSDGIFNSKHPSSKMKSMLKILRDRPANEKTIIFTHFTSLFDAITAALESWGISWEKYSGDMKNSEREDALKTIREDKSCTVIIISILAGGTGLNIVSCSSVILLDPWWNPYVEATISRVHRFGQIKAVNVYHLVAVNTVEVYIMETQVRKRELIEGDLNAVLEDEHMDERMNKRMDDFQSEEKHFQTWLANPSNRQDKDWRSMYDERLEVNDSQS